MQWLNDAPVATCRSLLAQVDEARVAHFCGGGVRPPPVLPLRAPTAHRYWVEVSHCAEYHTNPVSVCFILTNVTAICNQLQLCITNERSPKTRKGLLYKHATFLHELWRIDSSRQAKNNFGTDVHHKNLACQQLVHRSLHGLVSDATLSPEPFPHDT